MSNQTIEEKIKQRRTQMLIHSCIYYKMDDSIVDDFVWQKWADELTQLQTENPNINIGYYDEEFKDWTGAGGSHLPFNEQIRSKAAFLLDLNNSNNKA